MFAPVLVDQWQDELYRRFHLPFDILTNDKLEAARTGNWFLENNLVIARLDKLSRDESVQDKLKAPDCRWDLIVCDEAHKMSASFFGGEVKFTKRHKLGQMLSPLTRHFLLITATPHNGKEEEFQLFMSLIDGDRFEGRFRDGVHTADVSDLMRRMVKSGSGVRLSYWLIAVECHRRAAMARKPRVEYAGAFYHVICRGNQRQVIFRSDADRKYYLERLEQYRRRYSFKVYAYVLMSNHIHLLLETGRVPLSRIMQGLQLSYTGYFNRKYNKVGHLFQGRYKAILCDRDAYLLELVRYLHLNPERMRFPMQAATYRWSSHGAYLGKESLVNVETAPVLGEFAKTLGKARLVYSKFIADGKATGHQPDYYDVRDQRFLGDEGFVEEIAERAGADREISLPLPRAKLSVLLRLVAKAYGATEKDLVQLGRQRKWVTARSMLVFLGREWGRVSVKELGTRLRRDPSVISRLYSAYAAARDLTTEKGLLQQLKS